MRTIPALALAAVAAAGFATGAAADGLNVTPPLYREQARTTQQVRPARDLTTTPQPVAARPVSRLVVEARTN